MSFVTLCIDAYTGQEIHVASSSLQEIFLTAQSFYLGHVINTILATSSLRLVYILFEPRHDKTNKVSVRPAKTQINLGNRPV